MTRVLIVDDEPQMLRALQINLQAREYTVATAADGAGAVEEAARTPPDAIILDLGLPGLDGTDVIRALRAWSTVPVIVLSGRSGAADKVAALDAGADDYVTKPFSMNELLARLRAVLRRPATEEASGGSAVIGDFIVDLDSCTVRPTRGDVPATGEEPTVRLTPTEWRILTLLIHHPGRLVTGRHLLLDVWGPGHERKTNYLRVYLAGLRRKLERDPAHPRHLITEPGMGYRFEP
ncbi:two-component system KDP operon response regulator KdpE [Streptacidiphilus sp. MAP12-16]|uniref:response regulator n=1 Tax=Streptacidiphilus sp. MAP12-16 TaxID=3156300 RepID=UPI0035118111